MLNNHSDNPFEFIPDEQPAKPKKIEAEPIGNQLKSLVLKPINSSIKEIVVEQNNAILNRSMIDESDTSLSRENHVKFEFNGNRCFIENVSSNGSTFIQVLEKTEITNGTLIILGENKLFRVEF